MEDPGTPSDSQPKLIYTEKLTRDSTLKYSIVNFVNELKDGTEFEKRPEQLQLDNVVALPEPKIFAHFASKAYLNQKDKETREQFEERLQLPEGWKLLTTANNLAYFKTIRGYFGAVFWHPISRRIVIAHRGTIPTNLDALRADLNGILRNKYVKQMRAACTLTHRILEAVEECEKERNTHFEIYFTGHSLGAWLAQVTTFSLKYLTLEKETGKFLKNPRKNPGRHAHAEVFDSPGSSEMLQQMASDFDVRYSGKSTELGHLDITVYLSSPNFVNCCNSHVGTLYRVYSKIKSRFYVLYTLSSHSMDGILQTFNSSGPILMEEVVDWPKIAPTILQRKFWKIHKSILGKEYEDFFELAKALSYDPKLKDIALRVAASSGSDNESSILNEFVTIRYQLKSVRANQCSPSVFAESELKFLRNFQQLKILPNSIFDEDENKKETIEKLLQLTVGDQSVSCDDNVDIRQLIPYVKTLLRLYPDLNEQVKLALTDFEVRKQIYRDLTESYRAKMKGLTEILQNSDWSRLDELQRENQVCCILAEIGTDFPAAKALKKIDAKHADITAFAFELQSLLTLETFFHLTEFLKTDKNQTLILLECKSGSFSSSGNEDFVEGLIDTVRERADLKLILITDKNEPFISNNNLQSIIYGGIMWDELTNETKKHFITKEVIVFQGDPNKRSLEKLLRRTSMKMDFSQLADIVDAKTLARFLMGEEVTVGKSLTKPGDVYVTREFMLKPFVKDDVFNHITHGDVVAISGINQKDLESGGILSKKLKLLDGIKSGKIKMIRSDKDFEAFCSQNPRKNVHWLMYVFISFVFHKTRGSPGLLRNHIDDQMVLEFPEEELLENDVDRRTVIISDVPGMGKTTVLSVLAEKMKEKNPEQWVVRVNLNDCTEALKNAIPIETVSDALGFLLDQILPCSEDTKLNSHFEKKLFERALMIDGGVVLIFDGFDEISPDYESTVTRLLQRLQGTKIDLLVVTTRPHTKDRLEDCLYTLSHTMVPFSTKNYKELLLKIWKNRDDGTFEEKDLEKYADESIEFLEKSINDGEKSFLGIPLHCKLLAEYLWELKGEHRELEVLSLFELFEAFIRSKTNMYYEEKYVNTKGNTGAECQKRSANILSRQMHHQGALKIILSGDTWDELDYPEMEDELKETTEKDVLKLGLMTNTEDNPQFLHRTFAEFFVLDYTLSLAAGNVKKNSKKLTILSRAILLKREFGVIRAFLESLIKNINKVEETKNVLRSFVEFSSQKWSTNRADCLTEDKGTVLHRLLEEKLEFTFTLLFELMIEICPTEIPTFLSYTTEGGTALHIAIRKGITNIALSILQRIPDIISEDKSSLLDVAWKTDSRNIPLPKWQHIINARDSHTLTALHVASQLGQTQICSTLLEKGADINAGRVTGSTPLVKASSEGHLEVVNLLLEMGADINAISFYGLTPLGKASNRGHIRVVRFLLEKGADINASGNMSSPLGKASRGGHLEIVRFLLERGACINVTDKILSPLGEASRGGHLEIVRFLLERGADVNARDKYGSTPLGDALFRGHLEIVHFLLEKGADINVHDTYGSNVLEQASRGGHLEIVRLLHEKGADEYGSIALKWASFEGHLEVVRFLHEQGADINACVEYESPPLVEASSRGHLEVVRFLLENGADINARGNDGDTPLVVASCKEHLEIVRFLLEKGADVNKPGKTTSLHEASRKGHLDIAELLISNGANVNSVDAFGCAPLHEASSMGHLGVAELQISKGANVNSVDAFGRTPLHEASKEGHLGVAELLIYNGANVNSVDAFGCAPLHEASRYAKADHLILWNGAKIDLLERNYATLLHLGAEKGRLETVHVLLAHGANPLIKNNLETSWETKILPLLVPTLKLNKKKTKKTMLTMLRFD